jgi:hypothetical protein
MFLAVLSTSASGMPSALRIQALTSKIVWSPLNHDDDDDGRVFFPVEKRSQALSAVFSLLVDIITFQCKRYEDRNWE